MSDTFERHEMADAQLAASVLIRDAAALLEARIGKIADSREKSLAMTRLEEGVMWANKGLALHGVRE